jgi:hypothetical protein
VIIIGIGLSKEGKIAWQTAAKALSNTTRILMSSN